MNPRTKKSLEKILQATERRARRPGRRFSTAPLVLALGLVLADVMLVYLVPVLWESLLPRGLDQAERLVGWPGLIWRGAVFCHRNQAAVQVAIAVVAVVGFLACSRGKLLRSAVWLSSVAVIVLNAFILIVTLQTSLQATAADAGLDFGGIDRPPFSFDRAPISAGVCTMIRLGICNELFEGWDFAEVCRTVKAIGYDGLEIAPFTLAPRITDLSKDRRRELRKTVEDAGLATIGLHWLLAKTEGFSLTTPETAVRRQTAEYLVALAEATRDLGGSLMVFGSPKQRDLPPGVSYEEALGHAADVFTAIMPSIGGLGIDFCLEPLAPSETNFLNTCAQANELIARVNHPNFLLHMDVKAQSSESGTTVPALISQHAPRAGHFHAQDVNLRGPGMGDVDFGPILKALVDSGYDRWVSVEVFDFSPGAEFTARTSYTTLRSALDAARARRG